VCSIDADFLLDGTRPGDSVAVNGACLTAITVAGHGFTADLSPETLARTTLGSIKPGTRVNLERALRFSDRLGGHLVAGHVDGIGTIAKKETRDNSTVVTFAVPSELGRYVIEKGSIAVDGVSLTIYDCTRERFSASLIPHTAGLTTLGVKRVGDPVNIETDMIGKYVERFLNRDAYTEKGKPSDPSAIDLRFLAKSGFLK
jgi:riboflavin synthase